MQQPSITPRSGATQQTRSTQQTQPTQQSQPQTEQAPVVSPELLVDALSGQEDGLLAIAEKLMEHYDGGYDSMGEAIIDAFADVQKLFQHVVEAAHMEGAAFESSRRAAEDAEKIKNGELASPVAGGDSIPAASPAAGRSLTVDEFIDQDVKDCLSTAIRNSAALRDSEKHAECFQLLEQACQEASALLPVDSDHRGRLQLSIARAESMAPDRACAILRYAMDDVLRSGMSRPGSGPPSIPVEKRADVVLQKPNITSATTSTAGQSSEEALASLVEEFKDVLSAPIYQDTPLLQTTSQKFFGALQEHLQHLTKQKDKLEQQLAGLKGDFLLERAVSILATDIIVVQLTVQSVLSLMKSMFSFAIFRNGKRN